MSKKVIDKDSRDGVKENEAAKTSFNNTKAFKISLITIVSIFVILVIALIISESTSSKLIIKNNSGLKIEYLQYYFVGPEGRLNDEVEFKEIEAGKTIYDVAPNINLLGQEANLEIVFKFENHEEMFVDAGYFNDSFKGNIDIAFNKINENNIGMKVKAKNSIIPSNLISCNENFTINLAEGFVEE